MKIIVTGGIGSGKSTALSCFQELGFYCVKADDIARGLLADEKVKRLAVDLYGEGILENDHINKSKFAKCFFSDDTKRLIYESAIHPMVQEAITTLSKQHQFFVAEIPLLYEAKKKNADAYKAFDWIITIEAQTELRVERILKRDIRNAEEIEQIMAAQTDTDMRIKIADIVLINEKSTQALCNQIKNWVESF